jgi:hypothetical protein
MGEWLKARNLKWDNETDRKLEEIQDAFAPMCGSRSHTVRVVIDLMHTIVVTRPELLAQAARDTNSPRIALAACVSAQRRGARHITRRINAISR